MSQKDYFYIDNGSRLEKVVATNNIHASNLIIIPGGPGIGSEYLQSLSNILTIDHNIWLLDLPGNGDNRHHSAQLQNWAKQLQEVCSKFKNVILIGHSFSTYLILSDKNIENHIEGIILIGGSPSINVETTLAQTVRYNLPDATKLLLEYLKNKTDQAHKQLIINMVDTYFTQSKRDEGKKLLNDTSYNHELLDAWLMDPFWQNFDSQFTPTLPTFVINGECDRLCSSSMFIADRRFIKPNIEIVEMNYAAHFPWIERPEEIKKHIVNFIKKL